TIPRRRKIEASGLSPCRTRSVPRAASTTRGRKRSSARASWGDSPECWHNFRTSAATAWSAKRSIQTTAKSCGGQRAPEERRVRGLVPLLSRLARRSPSAARRHRHAEVLAQRRALELAAKQAAALQLRHDMTHEVLVGAGNMCSGEHEAVAGGR